MNLINKSTISIPNNTNINTNINSNINAKMDTDMTMDELWVYYFDNFKNVLHHLPYHKKVIDMFINQLDTISNTILYSHKGIPLELLYYTAFKKKFGNYIINKLVWDKDVLYNETPYFFEIDLSIPQQPKDLMKFTELIKHMVMHPCIHARRHIIIIKHIDYIVNNNKFYDFRVLFERYSENALFICTTHFYTKLEIPIRSRFFGIRIPLFTVDEFIATFRDLNLVYHDTLAKNLCQDLYFALYIHYLIKNIPEVVTEEFCTYNCPTICDFLKNKKLTMENIRDFTHKISINDSSIKNITMDLMESVPQKYRAEFLSHAAHIDHLLASTDGYRKPLYIEYLFHLAIYGNA